MAHVLIVHRYFWPSDASTYAAMLKDISELHRDMADRLTICTASATKEERAERQAWADALGIELHQIDMVQDRGRSIPSRLWSMIRFSAFALRIARATKPDALTVTSYPTLTIAVPLTLWAQATGRRLLFHVQDIFSQNLITRGGLKAWIGSALHRLERVVVTRAAVVVTLSEDMKAALGGDRNILVRQNYTPTLGEIRSSNRA